MQNEVSVLAAFFHMVIFMNNEKRIISFPAGKTYEHILHTSVHAHPIKRGFPKEPTSYVMFRKSGGEMEYLFRVKKTVDFYIQDLLSGTVSLSGIDNAELEQIKTYVLERKDLFGFKYLTEYPYRFYILEKAGILSPPLVRTPNIQGYCFYKQEDVIYHIQK